MNKLIEKFKRNELLDAAWFCSMVGKNVDDISLKDALGPFGDINSVGQLVFGKYRLILVYDKRQKGLYTNFLSDDRISDYIDRDLDSAFQEAIVKHRPYVYMLNIASVENFGAFEWKTERNLLDQQLSIFMPIIQKFMIDALTDRLEISGEEG